MLSSLILAIFPVASVGAAGAVPPIRGGKCHLWCLAPGQRIYGRWRALVRRARRLAVGPAAGIRYYPLSRLLEKGRCPGHCPERNERLTESIKHERPDGAHKLSPVPFGAAKTRKECLPLLSLRFA